MSKSTGKTREKSEKGNSNGLKESVEVKKELNLITKHLFSARLESIFYLRETQYILLLNVSHQISSLHVSIFRRIMGA